MGQVSAAGTRLQVAKGIDDSPERHFDDVMRITRGTANPEIVRRAVERAPATIDWLLDNGLTPMPDHPVTGDLPGRPGYTIPRYLWGANEGRDILAVVEKELAGCRVTTQLRSRVDRIVLDAQGSAVGVGAGDHEFQGRHILLTTGGYAMNPVAFKRHSGFPAYVAGSYPTCQGDGLDLALAAGGRLRGQDKHRAGTGSILTADTFPAHVYARFITAPQEREPWEIWVDGAGRRFCREDDPDIYRREQAVKTLPDLRYAIVFDSAILEEAPPGVAGFTREQMRAHFDWHPMFAQAPSLAELAAKLRIDPAGLSATIAQYNAAESGPRRIERPPFYGIVHMGHSSTSSTGVVVDDALRVLRGDGQPIANLYAAGEVLGSGATLGNTFCPGMMLGPALALGHWLGETLPL